MGRKLVETNLQENGEQDHDHHGGPEWLADVKCIAQLIGICREESDIHQALMKNYGGKKLINKYLGIALVVSHLLQVLGIVVCILGLGFLLGQQALAGWGYRFVFHLAWHKSETEKTVFCQM